MATGAEPRATAANLREREEDGETQGGGRGRKRREEGGRGRKRREGGGGRESLEELNLKNGRARGWETLVA